ncbi:MAG: DUF1599 domain-containing protein [Bacteroides sp.]|jgi:hypothetical protein|nr:DUF1599 domain-containing protein [Bacteroides sp.]
MNERTMGSVSKTDQQYDAIKQICLEVFTGKMQDYGTAWRVLRPASLTDQIYIKAQRIRSLQRKGTQKILEGIAPEFVGIVNYAVMGLIQLEKGAADQADLPAGEAAAKWGEYFEKARSLMHDKNHDYSEAWREMRVSSLADIILMKLLRVKQIEDNEGKTFVSEGVDANLYDIINYAVFALIKLELEGKND